MSADEVAVEVIGAGGHAKVVIATLVAAGYRVSAVRDDDPAKWGGQVLGVPISGPPDASVARAVIAVGSNSQRRALAERLPFVEWVSAVHPRAWVHSSVRLGPGTVVFAGAIVQPDAVLGSHVIVNTGATVDHDCSIGDFVHLAPGVHLAGAVTVGRGAFLGIGSVAVLGMRIGDDAVVGAGAVVIREVPARTTVVGVPAVRVLGPR